jgi:hypothetical protein
LPDRGVDAELAKERLQAEGAGLVGDNRHDQLADLGVAQQLDEDAAERLRGGDVGGAGGGTQELLEIVQAGHGQGRGGDLPLGVEAAQRLAAGTQVAHLFAIFGGLVERHLVDLLVGDGDTEAAAEVA